jgi:hypothetical protein
MQTERAVGPSLPSVIPDSPPERRPLMGSLFAELTNRPEASETDSRLGEDRRLKAIEAIDRKCVSVLLPRAGDDLMKFQERAVELQPRMLTAGEVPRRWEPLLGEALRIIPEDDMEIFQELWALSVEADRNRHQLSQSLRESIPIFRQYGLLLAPQPNILWLAGRIPSTGKCSLWAVRSGRTYEDLWELVSGSGVIFPSASLGVSPLSELLLQCLRPLLQDHELPTLSSFRDPVEWIGLVDLRPVSTEILQRELELCLDSQDLGVSTTSLTSKENDSALKEPFRDFVSVLRIELSKLDDRPGDLRGRGFQQLQNLLLLHCNPDALFGLEEFWARHIDRLESVARSSVCDESTIAKAMMKFQLALMSWLLDLDLDLVACLDAVESILDEFHNELIQARRARYRDDE